MTPFSAGADVKTHAPAPSTSLGQQLAKCGAGLFSLLVVGAVLLPVRENWRATPRDEFPLSYYPMFSKPRGETARVTYLVGIDQQGSAHPLNYRYAVSGGMNQARKQLRRHVSLGTADQLCQRVAQRVARSGKENFRQIEAVAVVTATFRLDEFIEGNVEPADVRIDARAPIARSQP